MANPVDIELFRQWLTGAYMESQGFTLSSFQDGKFPTKEEMSRAVAFSDNVVRFLKEYELLK
jgi:hypothetical protein